MQDQHDQRREVDPAEIGQDLADRPVERRGDPVERLDERRERRCELVLSTLNANSQLRITWAMMIQPRTRRSRSRMSKRAMSMAAA